MAGGGPGLLGLIWLVVLLVLLPLGSRPRGGDPRMDLPRRTLYVAASATLWFLAVVTAGIALWEGMGTEALNLRALPVGAFLAWSAGTFLACMLVVGALVGLQVLAGAREPAFVGHIMPREPGERDLFLLLSFSAGVCEEWMFRGFALGALTLLLGSPRAALGIQAVAFGAAHAYQSAWGLARAALLGVILAVPALLVGSIWPAVVAHMLVDAVGGLWLWPRYGRHLTREEDDA